MVHFGMFERRRFRGCGVGLGRLGFAGGLVRGSAASLDPIGRFRFGVKLTRGFHLMGLVRDPPLGYTLLFFSGIEAWKRRQNPDGRFGG